LPNLLDSLQAGIAVSGVKEMTNRKLIRKMLFAATLTMSTGIGTSAFAWQQYQPGEPGKQIPQGNTTVTQELNRMFQESGQTMPSMIAQDLPNANVPTQGQVRPKQQQHAPTTQTVNVPNQQAAAQNANAPQNRPVQQNAAQTRQANPPAKPGVLTKFFGKFRGDKVGNDPNYRPPVPPEHNTTAPKTTTNGNTNPTAAVGSASTVAPMTPPTTKVATTKVQTTKVPATAGKVAQNPAVTPPGNRQPRAANQSATSQAYHGNKPQMPQPGNAAIVRNGATSQIPPRSGSTVQPVNRHSNGNAAAVAGGNQSAYTQPGSAPRFMTATNSTAVIKKHAAAAPGAGDKFDEDFQQENVNSATARPAAQDQIKTSATQQPVGTARSTAADDDFDSPFLSDADAGAESDVLDLDALIDIPDGPSSSAKTATVETLQSAPPVVEETRTAETRTSEFDVNENENKSSTESQLGPDENPFTGVQLDSSDAEFFGGAEPAAPATDNSIPLTPMEDFRPDLPAMDLSLDGTPGGEVPSVDLPGMDETSTDFDSIGMSPGSQNQSEANPASSPEADTAGRAQLQASPDVPAAMSEAETEQLQQMAEQERRKQQKRLIQSRAGQTGFKGFCPVALRERRELVEANEQFTSTFGLQAYAFSSAESKAAFDAEPSRYAAAAGGSDVVVLVNSGEEQAGQLDYALWYRDRLYLFRSRETMTLFSKDPQRFASQY